MSTYSSNLRIELPTNGTQAGVWGDTTNNNLAYILETAVTGYQTISVTAASQALTYTNGPTSTAASNQAVYAMLRFTTTTGAAFAVYAPPNAKAYVVWNNSGYSMTVYNSTVIGNTTAAGTGVTITNGSKIMIWSDATNFYEIQAANLTGTLAIANGGTGQVTANAAFNALAPVQTTANGKYLKSNGTDTSWDAIDLSTSDISGTLAVANGGTGVTSSTGSGSNVLSASPAFTGTPTAPTAAGTTNSTQIATTAFVQAAIPSGVIAMWYGSIASIPTGWLLCNGASGTPDLRDRFIVGAGSTYSVAATGGSANATLVSHNHTGNSSFTGSALGTHTHTVSDPGHLHTIPISAGPAGGPPTPYIIPSNFSNVGVVQTIDTNSATTGVTIAAASAGTPAGSVSTSISTEGSSATNANLPPYYALAYIMKA